MRGINLGAERAGDELGAEQMPKTGLRPEAGREKIDFVAEKRIFVFVVNANGAPSMMRRSVVARSVAGRP